MFNVIVYHKLTKKIIAYLPFEFEDSVRICLNDSLKHKDFDFAVYNNTEPILFEDFQGDICLKENSFIIDGSMLME